MKKSYMLGCCLILLSGCVTTAEERAACEAMEKDMGTQTTHDHQAMKGAGMNPMNLTHERCQQILSRPAA